MRHSSGSFSLGISKMTDIWKIESKAPMNMGCNIQQTGEQMRKMERRGSEQECLPSSFCSNASTAAVITCCYYLHTPDSKFSTLLARGMFSLRVFGTTPISLAKFWLEISQTLTQILAHTSSTSKISFSVVLHCLVLEGHFCAPELPWDI